MLDEIVQSSPVFEAPLGSTKLFQPATLPQQGQHDVGLCKIYRFLVLSSQATLSTKLSSSFKAQ